LVDEADRAAEEFGEADGDGGEGHAGDDLAVGRPRWEARMTLAPLEMRS
jgi:hypothetical protein